MAASKGQRIASWVTSGLVAAMLGFSASFKFHDMPGKEAFDHIGYAFHTMRRIGVMEVLVAVLFLVPQTAFLGGRGGGDVRAGRGPIRDAGGARGGGVG